MGRVTKGRLELNFHGEKGRRVLRRHQVVKRRNRGRQTWPVKLSSFTFCPPPHVLHDCGRCQRTFLQTSNIFYLFARLTRGKIWCHLPPVKVYPVEPSRSWETERQCKCTRCFHPTEEESCIGCGQGGWTEVAERFPTTQSALHLGSQIIHR